MKDKNVPFYLKYLFHLMLLLISAACLLHPLSEPNRVQLLDLQQQINTVNLIHTPSSEPSQNKANKRARGPWRDSSAERQTLADSSLSVDTCGSARVTVTPDNIITQAFKTIFSQLNRWIYFYFSDFFDVKHDSRILMLYLPDLVV